MNTASSVRKFRQYARRWFGGYSALRKWVVGLLGLSILLVGAAMLLLPGPAIIVITLGLVVLATEFAWARRALRRLKKEIDRLYSERPGRRDVNPDSNATRNDKGARSV